MLLGVLFVYLGVDTSPQLVGGSQQKAAPVLYGLMLLVVAAAWAVPGLLLALIVTILGAASGNRAYVGAGIAFLAIFLGAYFYGIQITMMTKSATLIASGVVILAARWILLRVMMEDNANANA